jgi:hypothetical protein
MILNELEKGAGFYKYKKSYGEHDMHDQANSASTASMISMIFRFFLQSGEYGFFVKRLKNVVASKVNSDENIVGSIIQAEEDDSARPPRESYNMNPKRGYQKSDVINKSQLLAE